MKFLKVPIEDEHYQSLRIIVEAAGFSPEEFLSKLVAGIMNQYTQMIIEGREQELRALASQPAAMEAVEKMMTAETPEPGKLWTP